MLVLGLLVAQMLLPVVAGEQPVCQNQGDQVINHSGNLSGGLLIWLLRDATVMRSFHVVALVILRTR